MIFQIILGMLLGVFLIFLLIPIRLGYYRSRFRSKVRLVFTLFNLLENVLQKAQEQNIDIRDKEIILLFDKKCRITYSNINEVYADIERLCQQALQYHEKLNNMVVSTQEWEDLHQKVLTILNIVRIRRWELGKHD